MADEFVKGFAIFVTAGLGWMTLAGWYNTPSFEGKQLLGATQGVATAYDSLGIVLRDVLFFFAVIGALTFWVFLPLGRKLLEEYRGEPEVPE